MVKLETQSKVRSKNTPVIMAYRVVIADLQDYNLKYETLTTSRLER